MHVPILKWTRTSAIRAARTNARPECAQQNAIPLMIRAMCTSSLRIALSVAPAYTRVTKAQSRGVTPIQKKEEASTGRSADRKQKR
jgi:hypothetical protein